MTKSESKYYENSASKAYDINFTISDGSTSKGYLLASYVSVNMNESLPPQKDSIASFEDFQNANIARLSEAIADKTPMEAIAYLNQVQEGFAFEIWERKEKSFAAELLKNQIKKTVESEKGKILPSYSPENLSGPKRPKKIKSETESTKDKTLQLFMKAGISQSDAEAMIAKSLKETFEKGLNKLSIPATETKYRKCPKCNGLNPMTLTECMICKTNIKECEYCSNFTTAKESKTCKVHDSKGNLISDMVEDN